MQQFFSPSRTQPPNVRRSDARRGTINDHALPMVPRCRCYPALAVSRYTSFAASSRSSPTYNRDWGATCRVRIAPFPRQTLASPADLEDQTVIDPCGVEARALRTWGTGARGEVPKCSRHSSPLVMPFAMRVHGRAAVTTILPCAAARWRAVHGWQPSLRARSLMLPVCGDLAVSLGESRPACWGEGDPRLEPSARIWSGILNSPVWGPESI
jgi:hypothetical protein